MDIQQFSAEFDLLYNNVTSNQAPGLNEYEKSVFLTKAQYQLVKEYFNPRIDGVGGGFDGGEKRQYDFSSLIRTDNLFYVNTFKERISDTEKLDKRSKVYLFPMNYFLSVNEILSDGKYQYSVMPLEYSEYQRLMLKPYSYPVKRGAWRLITDKKNCNYVHEDADGNTLEDNAASSADYKILTTWADQKRTLKLHIEVGIMAGSIVPNEYGTPESIDYFWVPEGETQQLAVRIVAATKWSSDNKTYNIFLGVQCSDADVVKSYLDDEGTIECLQSFFNYLKENELLNDDTEYASAANHLDGMVMCSVPSKLNTFSKVETDEFDNVIPIGRTFTCRVVQIPTVEIIGKFNGIPEYQMRYVRKLSPIVLENLDNYGTELKINGISTPTECELPEETHEEILERAVTLAKIAWAGGTATTQAQAQQRDR